MSHGGTESNRKGQPETVHPKRQNITYFYKVIGAKEFSEPVDVKPTYHAINKKDQRRLQLKQRSRYPPKENNSYSSNSSKVKYSKGWKIHPIEGSLVCSPSFAVFLH